METRLVSLPLDQIESAALVVLSFEKENGKPVPGMADGWIEDLYKSGELKGKLLETALLHKPAGLKAGRLLVVGGGKAADFGAAELRKVAGAALRLLKSKGARNLALVLETGYAAPEDVSAAVEGAVLGDYHPDR